MGKGAVGIRTGAHMGSQCIQGEEFNHYVTMLGPTYNNCTIPMNKCSNTNPMPCPLALRNIFISAMGNPST